MAVLLVGQHLAHGEDRAAEVAEHEHAVALVGVVDGLADAVGVRPEAAVGRAARADDAHVGAGHLARELHRPGGDITAVRYDYDPDHARSSTVRRSGVIVNYRSRFDNAER